MHHLSLILCLTHNRHALARDNNIPTIHLATERSRPLDINSYPTSVGIRHEGWHCVRFSLRIYGHDRAHVNFTGVVSTLRRTMYYHV